MSGIINDYKGLSDGPIDHKDSSVVNAIFEQAPSIDFPALIGTIVFLKEPLGENQLPIATNIANTPDGSDFFGVVIGGDAKGAYPSQNVSISSYLSDPRFVCATDGQTIRVCTQGRCLALIDTVAIGMIPGRGLTPVLGVIPFLSREAANRYIVGRSLSTTEPGAEVFIPADIKREGTRI